MAKHQTHAILVLFATVFWKPSNNFRSLSGFGKMDDIRNSLAERGWVDSYPVVVCPITEIELKECMEERQAKWDTLKAATTPEAAVERQVWEKLFLKDGKLVKPEFSGNAGFRRASVFLEAMVQRFRAKPEGDESNEITGLVPVIQKDYEDETERIIDQQLENELRNVGTVEVPALDKLRATKRLFDLGCREIKIRRLYPSSTAQKLFGICMSDHNWPDLKIYSRFFLPTDDGAHIPFGPVRHDVLISMNNRKEADDIRQEIAKDPTMTKKVLNDKQKAMPPITAEEVSNYFSDSKKKSDSGSESKIMAKKDIEQVSKTNAVDFFKVAAAAVMENKVTPMVAYLDHAESLNNHKKLIDGGKGSSAAAALLMAKDHDDLLKMVRGALANGGNDLLVNVCGLIAMKKTAELTAALAAVKADVPAPMLTAVSELVTLKKVDETMAALANVKNPPPVVTVPTTPATPVPVNPKNSVKKS